jgi:predicted PurR-regulated permease PerM
LDHPTGNRFYFLTLILIVVILGYLSYEIVKPFLTAVVWAIVFATLFYPVHAFLLKYVRWRAIASLVTVLLVFTIILGPVSYLSYLMAQELTSLTESLAKGGDAVALLAKNPLLNKILGKILSLLDMTEAQFQQRLLDNLSHLDRTFMGKVTAGLGGILSRGFDFVLMFLSLFFFLKDGSSYLAKGSEFLPFSAEHRKRLISQTRGIVVSTIYGGVTVALLQGIIGGLAFHFLSIPSAVLWGVCMFVASFIPVLGTLVIWGPGIIYLLLNGSLLKGIILALVGVFGISMVDNIVRPLIVHGRTKLPTLVIFFSILGGIGYFGFIGFILGPLILALFISVLEIFRYAEEERLPE